MKPAFGENYASDIIGVWNPALGGDNPAAHLIVRAHANSGMVVDFPELTQALRTFGEEFRAGAVEHTASVGTFLLVVNEGNRGGSLTLTPIGPDGVTVLCPPEYLLTSPHSWTWYPVASLLVVGSLKVKMGRFQPETGVGGACAICGTPASAPDGPVWGWYVVAPPCCSVSTAARPLVPWTVAP